MIIEFEKSLGYTRDEMPQIDPHLSIHFLIGLKEKLGVSIDMQMMSTKLLKNTQKHFNQKRIATKLKEIESKGSVAPMMKPIIVSQDLYILDGHNTAEALRQTTLKDSKEACVIVVDAPIEVLLEEARNYKYSYNKSINKID